MASPVVEATNSSVEAGSTSDHTIDLPASIAADENLYLIVGVNFTVTLSGTLTTEYAQFFDGINPDRYQGWWKRATGSEGATVDFTTSASQRSAHVSFRVSGALDATPTVSTVATGDSTAPDPNNIAPGVGSEDFLWLATMLCELGTNTTLISAPTNYSNFITAQASSGSGGCSVAVASRQLTAESEDPGAFDIDSDQWAAYGIGIRPAAAGDASQLVKVRFDAA